MAARERRRPTVSASLDAFSTVLRTLVEVSVFIRGCFQCHQTGKDEVEGSGAWFDHEQTNVDQPYCYINPIAINSAELNGSVLQFKAKRESSACNVLSLKRNGIERGATTIRSTEPFSSKTSLASNGITNPPNGELYLKSSSKAKYYKHKNGVKTSSFAINVEKEYIGRRNDFLRCDGESAIPKLRSVVQGIGDSSPDGRSKRQKLTSPVMHRHLMHQRSIDSDSHSWDNISLDSLDEEELKIEREKLFGDVWRSWELEDVFEDYNLAAFNSFGSMSSVFHKKLSNTKSGSEKFEDVFPTKRHHGNINIAENNNIVESVNADPNKTITLYEPDADQGSTRTSIDSNFSVLKLPENVIDQNELNVFIEECIFLNSKDDLDTYSHTLKKRNIYCDTILNYCEKSFTILLIFDLVKETMNECELDYPCSISLCSEYPVQIVQTRVLNILRLRNDDDCTLPVITSDIECVRNKMNEYSEPEKLPDYIDRITNEELKKDSKLWQGFQEEEEQMKEIVFREILNNFLISETEFISQLVANKTASLGL